MWGTNKKLRSEEKRSCALPLGKGEKRKKRKGWKEGEGNARQVKKPLGVPLFGGGEKKGHVLHMGSFRGDQTAADRKLSPLSKPTVSTGL